MNQRAYNSKTRNNQCFTSSWADDSERLKKLLGQTAKMTFHLVNNSVRNETQVPIDTILFETEPDSKGRAHKIPLFKSVVVHGD